MSRCLADLIVFGLFYLALCITDKFDTFNASVFLLLCSPLTECDVDFEAVNEKK